MLEKTQGIVLQTVKHSDSGIVAHVFSNRFGLISLMVKGVHSKKRGHMTAYFQPLQIINLDLYYKPNYNLHSVKEVSQAATLKRIPFDLRKNSIAFFVGEVLRKTLNHDEPNIEIYNYIHDSIVFLDNEEEIANFHIGFLVGLAQFLGISPSGRFGPSTQYFDMQNGMFCTSPPLHGYYLDRKYAELLSSFSGSSLKECNSIPLTGLIRSEFLDNLLNYYIFHLPGLKKIKSLEVLSEIFR